MPLGLTEVGYLDKIYFALGANSTAGSEQTTVGSYKWSTVKYTINWVVSWILLCVYRIDQNVQAIAPDVNSLKNNLGYANNYLKAIDTSTKNHRSDFGSAWGYGYGGTSVINKNSPAYWLPNGFITILGARIPGLGLLRRAPRASLTLWL